MPLTCLSVNSIRAYVLLSVWDTGWVKLSFEVCVSHEVDDLDADLVADKVATADQILMTEQHKHNYTVRT